MEVFIKRNKIAIFLLLLCSCAFNHKRQNEEIVLTNAINTIVDSICNNKNNFDFKCKVITLGFFCVNNDTFVSVRSDCLYNKKYMSKYFKYNDDVKITYIEFNDNIAKKFINTERFDNANFENCDSMEKYTYDPVFPTIFFIANKNKLYKHILDSIQETAYVEYLYKKRILIIPPPPPSE